MTKTIHETFIAGQEAFDEGCNEMNISDPPTDTKWIKEHNKQQTIALLESVVAVVEEGRKVENITSENETEHEYLLRNNICIGYNKANEQTAQLIREEIKKIQQL
jgi:hypothetical protein